MQMDAAVSPSLSLIGSDDAPRGGGTPCAQMSLEPVIREELDRILRSRVFSLSTRMRRFLRFVVEATLEGLADSLKEYVIGTEVYDRKPPYEPSQDSIVRTEAHRLRNKLKKYYDSEGKSDPLLISLPAGSYVPVFAPREQMNAEIPQTHRRLADIPSDLPEVLIVVMPFEDVSGDRISKDCARAISESIALGLMTIERCRVVHSGSAWNAGLAPWEQSKTHGCDGSYLALQGTVARSDRSLRITLRLGDPAGYQLWSIQLDLEAERTDLFRLIDQIASAITSRMRVQDFKPRCSTLEERTHTNHILAEVLSTENLMHQNSPADWRSIQARFENVLRSAPNHARAHSDVANCLVEEALSGISGSSATVSKAKSAILRALECDSRFPAAHACLGLVLALENDLAGAERHFEHSSALGSDGTGHREYALLLAALGRFEEARHHIQRAQAMDPFSARQKVARSRVLYLSRDFGGLVREHERLPIYGSKPLESESIAALAYLELGRLEQAKALAKRIRFEAQSYPPLMASVAEIFARCGDIQATMGVIERLRLFACDSPIGNLRQASLALALGDEERAIGALIASYEMREAETLWLRVDPRFDLVRDLPGARGLDAWHEARTAKYSNFEAESRFARYACLHEGLHEVGEAPRVA